MNRMLRGMVFTIISALLFGVTPILASMTFQMGSNANTLTFYRNIMVVPVLLCVMGIRKIPFRITLKELGFLLLVGVVFGPARPICCMNLTTMWESVQLPPFTSYIL